MKVSQITNVNFKGKTLRISVAQNKDYKFLNNKVMELTSVYSPFKSGKMLFTQGPDACIDINDPAKGLEERLNELGIKFNIIV